MDVFQYIFFFTVILIMPPVTWIYSLINWVIGGCRVKLFTLEDVAICESGDDDMDVEDFTVLQQMLDDYVLDAKNRT